MQNRNYKKHSIYLKPNELEQINQKLEASGLSLSAFARELLLGKEPIAPKQIPVNQFRELSHLGNNLNQLARMANRQKLIPANLLGLLESLKASLEQIREAL